MTEYTGSIFAGVIGSELDYAVCRESFRTLIWRPGDEFHTGYRGTKGYETRQQLLNNFLNSKHDFCLFLDADMVFQPDTVERLRSHKLPFVSGLYMRRTYNPIWPVWYRPFDGRWPMKPWLGDPERGRLHEIGASGWGCMLVHREVIMAVRRLLKGEREIIEDDMDVWPYNLGAVMAAIRGLRSALTSAEPNANYQAISHLITLENEIRPLRCSTEPVGSDIRFAFFAREAGYPLMGDPDVRPAHVLHYPLSPDDYSGQAEEYYTNQQEEMDRLTAKEENELAARKAWMLR